jgi:hypothetical protein
MNLHILLIIAFVAVFVALLRLLPSKGEMGEKRVAGILSRLPRDKYQIMNDLLIHHANGHTSQIDHVVVSEYGIFVIETKNYSGWIYGGANSEYWTQNIYGKKYQLYNPIQQNQGHVRALRRILKDLPSDMFISIVAFSRRATLKNRYLDNVVYWNQINRVIQSYSQKRMSAEQVQRTFNTLQEANNTSKDSRKQHVHNVRGQIYKNYVAVSNGYCPRCGGKLVLRSGQYGNFYGCSNYPRCRYTHPV